MIWSLSNRFDPRSAALADRHYSRQNIGSPQFMPPGRSFVLHAAQDGAEAVWGTSWPLPEFTTHAWSGAWVCSVFRNEGVDRSSRLIRAAVAATRWRYGEPPAEGMVTFVREDAVRPKADPGHCFIIAGFRPAGRTKTRGLLALHLPPAQMPPPEPPMGAQMGLFP